MRSVEQNDHEELTLLELALQCHGEFRRSLKPLRVTPLQAGVILYLHRHPEAKLKEPAAALGLTPPTLAVVIQDLVRKRWVTKRRALHDDRALCLRLSRQGEVLARKIKGQVRPVSAGMTANKILTTIVANQK